MTSQGKSGQTETLPVDDQINGDPQRIASNTKLPKIAETEKSKPRMRFVPPLFSITKVPSHQ